MRIIDEKNYLNLFPNTYNMDLTELDEEKKQQVFTLWSLYYNLLLMYIENKVNLSKYDKMIADSDLKFNPVEEDNMDIYQWMSSEHLNYIYLRSNMHIERLNDDELKYLIDLASKPKIEFNEEVENFIENSFNLVVAEGKGDVDINYGPNSIQYYLPSDSLVLGLRHNGANNIEDEFDIDNELLSIFAELNRNLQSKVFKNAYVIEYNNYSVKKKLNDEIKRSI